MPIKIHHGPNGSYKTSGAVWDDAVMAMKAGRPIITNIRGMSTERCLKMFPDLPAGFEVIHIDTETVDGRKRAASWFQWAPRNAFLIFDEPQVFFLKSWTDRHLTQFEYPGGPDQAKADERPSDWMDAWTRHRHWNWDVVLCTPNIRYLRDDIRQTSEMAYLHTNLGVLGGAIKFLLRADYKEVMHNAQDNRPTGDRNLTKFKKIDPRVFQLYDSTATGQHRDTFTGQSLLGSNKIVGLLGFAAVCMAVIWYRTGFSIGIGEVDSPPPAAVSAAAGPSAGQSVRPAAALAPDGLSEPLVAQQGAVGPFAGHNITIKAALDMPSRGVWYRFEIERDGKTFAQDSSDLRIAGYSIRSRGLCVAELSYQGTTQTVLCSGSTPGAGGAKRNAERRDVGAGSIRSQPSAGDLVSSEASTGRTITVVGSGNPGILW